MYSGSHDAKQDLERLSVQDVLSSYTLAVTRHDYVALIELFTPEGSWEAVGTGYTLSYKGEELGPGLKSAIELADASLAQINAPAVIAVNGDTATAVSMIHEFGDMADHSARVYSTGIYEDKLVKVNGKWKFQSRYFTAHQVWRLPYPAK
jgi:hypothetical protein